MRPVDCAGLLLLSDNIYDYHFVSQGQIKIPSMDDGDEMAATNVRLRFVRSGVMAPSLSLLNSVDKRTIVHVHNEHLPIL